jgi:DNA-binding response OmpR family regulator
LVEDDEACAYAVQGGLELLDVYEVRWAANGKEALHLYASFRPDVIVSDVHMPEMDGFELARTIRKNDKRVIILLATGLTSPKDLREGYHTGIDEYVKKPYIAEELHYRIQAIMKRSQKEIDTAAQSDSDNRFITENNRHITIGRYIFDPERETLALNNQVTQKLTSREAQLLLLLHQNCNGLVCRSEILQRFWPDDDPVFASRSLDVFISKLRKYLSKDKSIQIVNERGKGLKLEIE